jgi:hypothetical protein
MTLKNTIKSKSGSAPLMRRAALLLMAAGSFGNLARGADNELVNYRSGIDLNFGDSAGTAADKGIAYCEEYLYFDKIIDDRKVVYIKDSTLISMGHNSRNIAGSAGGGDSYEGVGTNVGAIKYKVDGDLRFGMYPQNWTGYSAPFAFRSLNYGLYGAAGIPVVGSTGSNGQALTVANQTTYYHKGIADSVGDEWHTLTVADDDIAVTSNAEFRSSDGKVFTFVVNPKTPCLTWRASGNGQFYTTPAKVYFQPYIYSQTTYFDPRAGGVSVEIRDINGNKVFYRIVTDPNDTTTRYTDAGSASTTLDQSKFATGKSYLQYYYLGREANKKTRVVVKSPGYPSASEVHGDRLWVNLTEWNNKMATSLKNDWWMTQWRTKDVRNGHTSIVASRRKGRRATGTEFSFVNALVARTFGMNADSPVVPGTTFAEFAKQMLIESALVLDPMGAELNLSNNPIPCRELLYRGYYDVRKVYNYAAAYDILIGYYRENQGNPKGITPVEDYFIRDTLARWTTVTGMATGSWTSPPWQRFDSGGMWETAHKTGAAFIAAMMPNYSTPYFGTAGLNGNSKTYSHIVFPTLNHTWFNLYLANNVVPVGFPGVATRMGVDDYLFIAKDGTTKWADRISYADTPLMGQCIGTYYNLLKLFNPTKTLPRVDAAMAVAAKGQLFGDKFISDSDRNARFFAWSIMCNSWHASFRSVAQPKSLALPETDSQHPAKQMNTGGIFYVLWYNRDLPLGQAATTTPPPPTTTEPTILTAPKNLRKLR